METMRGMHYRASTILVIALAPLVAARAPAEPVRFTAPADSADPIDTYGLRPLVGRIFNLTQPYPGEYEAGATYFGEDNLETVFGRYAPVTGFSCSLTPCIGLTIGGFAGVNPVRTAQRGEDIGVPLARCEGLIVAMIASGELVPEGDDRVWASFDAFVPDGTSYIPVQLWIDSRRYAAWIGVVYNPQRLAPPALGTTVPGDALRAWVFAWGYETQPDTPIAAGAAPCPADVDAPFGVLDFADIAQFLESFSLGSPLADLAPPFDAYDFADVLAFVGAFAEGCP